MSYIKAKYNGLYRPYMKTERQGFGSLYGGNQSSVVSNQNTEHSIDGTHWSHNFNHAEFSNAFDESFN